MPEGDTIWRTAERLRPVLVGQTVKTFSAERLAGTLPGPGATIDRVVAKGKYLLIHLVDERLPGGEVTLETHMKMTGSWHIYRTGERWQRSRRAVRCLIQVESGWEAVCFSAPHVKLTRASNGPTHLGPDLCTPDADLDEAVRRFHTIAYGATPIGVALLDQRICCGVGNVFKSEVLFACELHPETPVEAIDHETRTELIKTAATLLQVNLSSGTRITVPGVPGGLGVYGRKADPCHRCRTPIKRIVQGEHARSTYFCPTCQPVGRTSPDS